MNKIKIAYGIYYNILKDKIDDEGWCEGYPPLDDTYELWLHDVMPMEYVEYYDKNARVEIIIKCRPLSLKKNE